MVKLRITAVEGQHQGQVFEVQFNPKEIEVDRAVPWQQQLHKGPADLEFEGGEPARMTFELLFDGVETSKSVQPQLSQLNQLVSVDDDLHRPPKVKVSWGSAGGAMPTFNGVIESVSVRYLVFAENGVPLRATAGVTLKEASHLRVTAP